MKSLFAPFLLFLFLFPINGFGQDTTHSSINFGIRYNFSYNYKVLHHIPTFSMEIGQSDKKAPIPFNEFTVSLNRIFFYSKTSSLDERIGFGFGVKRFWFEDKKIHLIAGIAYNQYRLYKSAGRVSDDPNSAYLTNMRFRLHTISLPISVRFLFGNSIQFFTEVGTYMNYNFNQTIKGKSEDQIKKYKLTPPDIFFDAGGTVGVGLRIPVKSNRLIIKSYYGHSIWNTGVINLSLGFQILRKT